MRLTTLILPAALLVAGFLASLVIAASRPAVRPMPLPVPERSAAPRRSQS